LNGSKIITNFKQVMASNTRILSTSLVNETRFGYTKFYNTTGPELAFARDVVGELGIPGLASGPPVQWGIPNVSLSGAYSGFGNDSEGTYENNNSSIQFARGQFTFTRNATSGPGVSGHHWRSVRRLQETAEKLNKRGQDFLAGSSRSTA
jgi:hypothetical protein